MSFPRTPSPAASAYVSGFSSSWSRTTDELDVYQYPSNGKLSNPTRCKVSPPMKVPGTSESTVRSDWNSHSNISRSLPASSSIAIPKSKSKNSNVNDSRSRNAVSSESKDAQLEIESSSSVTRSSSNSSLSALDNVDSSGTFYRSRQRGSTSPVPAFSCPTTFSSWKRSMEPLKTIPGSRPNSGSGTPRVETTAGATTKLATFDSTWDRYEHPDGWCSSGGISLKDNILPKPQSTDHDAEEQGVGLEQDEVFAMEMEASTDSLTTNKLMAQLTKAMAGTHSGRVLKTSVVPSMNLKNPLSRRCSSVPRKCDPDQASFQHMSRKSEPAHVPSKPAQPSQSELADVAARQRFEKAQNRWEIFRQPRVVRAWEVACEAHHGQYRRNGEAYVTHCLETASILAELGLDEHVVIAGLLHDTLDDTRLSLDKLQTEFGFDIANLVCQVSKLSQINQLMRRRRQPFTGEELDSLNKMLLSMITDIRVVMVKMADRLHNMRTIHVLPSETRHRMAVDSLNIYVPLANRLGIWQMKAELEDLCFEVLHPDACRRVRESLEADTIMTAYINESIRKLAAALEEEGISSKLQGRTKSLYSIYRKMKQKQRVLKDIIDVRAVRIIVNTVEECYTVVKTVHALWKPIPSEYNDYIRHPKPNNYQSLHTAVIGSNGFPFEVQIRTQEMHQVAEYGIAAHWKYKEQLGSETQRFLDEKIQWLRSMLEWRQKVMSGARFDDVLKLPEFPVLNGYPSQDTIVVVTSQGEIMELPVGSSVRDAAARLGCASPLELCSMRVNHRTVDPMYHLRDGDLVHLIPCVRQTSFNALDVTKPQGLHLTKVECTANC